MNKIAAFLFLLLSSCGGTNQVVYVNHPNLPKPIGPYSHATSYGDLLFISGQIGIDPETNTLKEGIEQQTLQILENVKLILNDNNSDLEHITKTTIFVRDMNDFEVVNKLYGSYFTNHYPARSTVQVASLPRDAAIEIEFIAVKR